MYERPLTPNALLPALVFAPVLGCFVRPQPLEFLRFAASTRYRQNIHNAIPSHTRHAVDAP